MYTLRANIPTNTPDQLGTVILLIMKFSTPDFGPRDTLTCPHSSAGPSRLVGHRFGDADDETSHQRGVWDVPADYVKVAFNVSSLERPQRPPPCGRCSLSSRECSLSSRRNYEITASSNKANNPLCFGRAPCFAVTCYRERQHIRATITVIRTSTR